MELPFTRDAFFALFGQYNLAVWPLIVLFYLMAAATVALLFRSSRAATMLIALGLGAMWVVNGAGYHWMFFSGDQSGSDGLRRGFCAASGPSRPLAGAGRFRFAVAADARSAVGLLMILFAIVLYPLWGWGAGHVWPRIPAFGVAPCPTTIFTIGVLLTGSWHVVCWQDSALLAALVLLILFAVARMSGDGFRPSHRWWHRLMPSAHSQSWDAQRG